MIYSFALKCHHLPPGPNYMPFYNLLKSKPWIAYVHVWICMSCTCIHHNWNIHCRFVKALLLTFYNISYVYNCHTSTNTTQCTQTQLYIMAVVMELLWGFDLRPLSILYWFFSVVVQKLNDELSQGTLSEPAIFLYLLGNSLNNLTAEESTEQDLELFTEVKFWWACVKILCTHLRGLWEIVWVWNGEYVFA